MIIEFSLNSVRWYGGPYVTTIILKCKPVSLNHDGTDGTGIQSVSPVPSASIAAGPSVPSASSRRKLTNLFIYYKVSYIKYRNIHKQ